VDVHVTDRAAAFCAAWIGRRLRRAVKRRGLATLAVSGGSTAPPMFDLLARLVVVPWDSVDIWQVDERVAPDGHPDRNAGQLADVPGRHHLMPVTSADLRRAARRYAAGLPDRFDVIHLGVGPDGHTASWPPGDPVIDSDRLVDVSDEYQDRRRMTLTPSVVNAAPARIVLVTGADKAEAVADWIGRTDASADLPISRVRRTRTVAVLDPAAATRLDR